MRGVHLFLVLVVASLFTLPPTAAESQEPSVRIETLPRWQSATLNIYIFGMPQDQGEYTQSSITLRVAVWGATEDNPLTIQLDNEQAALITSDGLFTYEWTLRGSHHLLLRDQYKIFDQAAFNIEAPPPPPAMIQLANFNEALETQFYAIFRNMLGATVLGVGFGVQAKKWTRKKADIGLIGFAAPLLYGGLNLADWYILVPFGAAGIAAYWLMPDFVEYFGLGYISDQSWRVRTIELDQNGFILQGVGLKYWRDRFIKRKEIIFEKQHLTTFDLPRGILKGVVVKSFKEDSEKVSVECDDSVSELLIRAEAFDEAKTLLQETKVDLLKEQALNTIRKEREIRERTKENVYAIFQGREPSVRPAGVKS